MLQTFPVPMVFSPHFECQHVPGAGRIGGCMVSMCPLSLFSRRDSRGKGQLGEMLAEAGEVGSSPFGGLGSVGNAI